MQLSARQRFAVSTLANLGVWTFVALASTDVVLANAEREGIKVDLGHVLRGQLHIWLPMTLVTWMIFRVARRLHRGGASLRRTVFWQLLIWLGWTLAYTLYLLPPTPDLGAWIRTSLARFAGPGLWLDAMVYLAVVGAAYGTIFYRGYSEHARRAAELRERLTGAELAALRTRLDPHFLFNSLNTVAALVRTRDPTGALEAIARLSNILRATLATRDRTWVRLDEELEVATAYLALQKLRFGGALEIEIGVDDDCRPARVPDMVLLPLVENAVRHGAVGGVTRHVALTASRDNGVVRVTLANPLGESDVDGDVDGGAEGDKNGGFGIGLETTRARLDRLFGPAASLDLEMTDDARVITRLAFPFTVEETVP